MNATDALNEKATVVTDGIFDDIPDGGLVIIYGSDNAGVKNGVKAIEAGLREQYFGDEQKVFVNFDKEKFLPETNNIGFFYDIGLLPELSGRERDDAMQAVFIRSVMSEYPPHPIGWDRVVMDAPDVFLPSAIQAASLGGLVVVSVTADSLSEVMDKFTGLDIGLRQTLKRIVAVEADGEDASFSVTDPTTSFWKQNPVPASRAADFPSLVELGGPDVVSSVLLHASGGLAVVSGKSLSGKTTVLSALAHELKRAGKRVIAVRGVDAGVMPGVEEVMTADFEDTLVDVVLEKHKPDVVFVDEIRSSRAAMFALKLVEAGVLVVVSMHAINPERALFHILHHGRGLNNELIANSLLFSYGVKLRLYDQADKLVDEAIAEQVKKAERLTTEAYRTIVPSTYDPHRYLSSTFMFPDAELRESIRAYSPLVVNS